MCSIFELNFISVGAAVDVESSSSTLIILNIRSGNTIWRQKMSEKGFDMHENGTNGNSAVDWEIFDILCKDELGINELNVSCCEYCVRFFSEA